MVAIPAVWLYNYFSARLDTLFSELAYAGRELVDWMMTREANRERSAAARTPRRGRLIHGRRIGGGGASFGGSALPTVAGCRGRT